jgi:hypothetical protein
MASPRRRMPSEADESKSKSRDFKDILILCGTRNSSEEELQSTAMTSTSYLTGEKLG